MIISSIVTQGCGVAPPFFILQGYWAAIYENDIESPTQALVGGSPNAVSIVQVTPSIAAVVTSVNTITLSASANAASILMN